MTNEIICTNLDDMVGQMRAYAIKTGHKLEPNDSPERLMLGFVDTVDASTRFLIKIIGLNKKENILSDQPEEESNFNSEEKMDLIARSFKTEDGRLSFIDSMVNRYLDKL